MALSRCSIKENTEADTQAINGMADAYVQAISTGDLDAMMDLMDDDVVMMPPNESTRSGEEAVRSWYKGGFDRFNYKDAAYPTDEIQIFGVWALKRGQFMATLVPKTGGDPVHIHIKAIHILKKQSNGAWKISHAIWNSNPASD